MLQAMVEVFSVKANNFIGMCSKYFVKRYKLSFLF
jgi:hypothetical protein